MCRANDAYHVPLLQHIRPARLRASVTTAVVTLLLLAPALANAQQHRIDILVDARLQGPAEIFLDDLSASLAAEAHEVVRFEPTFVSGAELSEEVQDNRWAELAILSSTALTGSARSSALAAFEMPFVLPDVGSVIDLQRSPVGVAGLSRMDDQGMVGLVYLNAGTTLIASSIRLDEPDDLQGRKVAVSPQDGLLSLALLDSELVAMAPVERENALSAGYVEATVVNSGDTESWTLPAGGYLVTNSIQAQVGLVLAVNRNWYEIPFPYRAMIGDAAIAASTRRDESLVESEQTLREQAEAMRLSPVTFQAGHTSNAIDSWIEQQPEEGRDVYIKALEDVESVSAPRSRIPVGQQRGGEAGRIFFATTREDTHWSDLKYRFSDLRAATITCGEISYQPSRGEFAGADIVGTVTVGNAACGDYLKGVLQQSERTLIFVHGFNNQFSDAAARAMLLKDNLGADSEVVLWSWPSRRDAFDASYRYDKESTQGVALRRFEELLEALTQGVGTPPSLDILAHSMGGYHATNAVERLSSHGSPPHLRNLVFAAPDVPTDEFRFALENIRRSVGRITLYACGWDWALSVSQRLNQHARVGMGGREIFVDSRLDSINVSAELLSGNHSYVFDAGPTLQDMKTLLLTDVDAMGRGLQRRPKAPWHYWEWP